MEPGEIEAVMKEHPQVRGAAVELRDQRLVGYVVGAIEPDDLTGWLRERLPEHMVPGVLVEMAELPLTVNGKVDRRALPDPGHGRREPATAHAAPRTAAEAALVEIWAEVLRLDGVSVDDNFFTLGGDSILSIHIVALAARRGLHLRPHMIFQHQTVAALAAALEDLAPVEVEQGSAGGEVPLTPVQRWFVERVVRRPDWFNQAMLTEVPGQAEAAPLEAAVEGVVRHHDALRLRLRREEAGWRQWVEAEETGEVFRYEDLGGLDDEDRSRRIGEIAEETQRSLDLARGPVVRVVLMGCGEGRRSRLLVVVHHMAVDAVSWQVLIEDLWEGYRQAAAGQEVRLRGKTTSFKRWAERLAEWAGSDDVGGELEWWLGEVGRWAPIPRDLDGGENVERNAGRVEVELTEEETEALLREVPGVHRTQVNDALLGALLGAMSEWSGRRSQLVEVEGHGREELFEGVDLSRTVGWFTVQYPVLLEADRPGEPGAAVREIRDRLREVPRRGIGYGLLRYLAPDGRRLGDVPQAEVGFNYLGRSADLVPSSSSGGESSLFGPAPEPAGRTRSPDEERSHLLDVEAAVGGGRLRVSWIYSRSHHRSETVQGLAERYVGWLRALIGGARDGETAAFTPADFPHAGLTQVDLDRLMENLEVGE